MSWTFEEGYEGKRIVDPESVKVEELKTDKAIITAYNELGKASHWRNDKAKGALASSKSRSLADEVRTRLETVGWHAHIFPGGSTGCRCHQDLYLHGGFGSISVHQVPFASEWNISLSENELFKKDGDLRTKDESLKLLRERIGDQPVDLDKMVSDYEIDEDIAKTIRAIMKGEDLDEVHEVDEDYRSFRSGAKEYTWRDGENEAKDEARERLEDGELWKMAVEAGRTTEGLEDWVDMILSMDGWQNELCSYDGASYELEDGKVYWRSN